MNPCEHNDDAPKIDSNLDFAGAPARPLAETMPRATGRSRDGNHADPSWIVNVRLSSCRASRLRLPSKVETSADYPVEILNAAEGQRVAELCVRLSRKWKAEVRGKFGLLSRMILF